MGAFLSILAKFKRRQWTFIVLKNYIKIFSRQNRWISEKSWNEFEDVKIKRFIYRRIGLTDVIKQIFSIILGIIKDFFLLMPKLKLDFCEFLIKKALSETKWKFTHVRARAFLFFTRARAHVSQIYACACVRVRISLKFSRVRACACANTRAPARARTCARVFWNYVLRYLHGEVQRPLHWVLSWILWTSILLRGKNRQIKTVFFIKF